MMDKALQLTLQVVMPISILHKSQQKPKFVSLVHYHSLGPLLHKEEWILRLLLKSLDQLLGYQVPLVLILLIDGVEHSNTHGGQLVQYGGGNVHLLENGIRSSGDIRLQFDIVPSMSTVLLTDNCSLSQEYP